MTDILRQLEAVKIQLAIGPKLPKAQLDAIHAELREISAVAWRRCQNGTKKGQT